MPRTLQRADIVRLSETAQGCLRNNVLFKHVLRPSLVRKYVSLFFVMRAATSIRRFRRASTLPVQRIHDAVGGIGLCLL